jgi:ribosomal protein S18 acetylase RimI-like enzyme
MVISEVAPGREWHALDDDVTVGRAYVRRRPDRRTSVAVDAWHADVGAALLDAVLGAVPGPLYAVVGDEDAVQLALFGLAGFAEVRREDELLVRVRTGPAEVPGFTFVTAADLPLERHARLDEELRADVPGSDGWVNDDLALFRSWTVGAPWFDPALYPVAVDAAGEPAGLVRVWARTEPGGVPRLGLVAVRRPYRRRGLGRALLHRAFGPLVERGVGAVAAEVDVTNRPSRRLLDSFGTTRTGGTVELRRQPTNTQNGWPSGSA